MGSLTITVSLRREEIEAITKFLKENPAFPSRHSVVKLGLRRLLFPHQITKIPINGHTVDVNESFTMPVSKDPNYGKGKYIVITKSPYDIEQDRKAEIDKKRAEARAKAEKFINDIPNSQEEKVKMRAEAVKIINEKWK